MSEDLYEELCRGLNGRVCLVGIGNGDLGDDGFGLRLAEALRGTTDAEVVLAGTTPERWVGRLAGSGFDNVVFLDAVDVAGPPGTAVFMDAAEVEASFPQMSTHKFSLGTLARLIRMQGDTRVWLLGVQPASLVQGTGLTRVVTASLEALRRLICDARPRQSAEPTGRSMS